MSTFKVGDSVRIIARDQTAADVKSQLYYPHMANLRGKVLKVFGEEASVNVDRTTLPAEIRSRHEGNEKAMRQRYLDGLSDEVRNRMSAKEKHFMLNYTILVSLKDLREDDTPVDTADSGGAAEPAARVSENDLDAKEAAFLAERAAQNSGDRLTRPA